MRQNTGRDEDLAGGRPLFAAISSLLSKRNKRNRLNSEEEEDEEEAGKGWRGLFNVKGPIRAYWAG